MVWWESHTHTQNFAYGRQFNFPWFADIRTNTKKIRKITIMVFTTSCLFLYEFPFFIVFVICSHCNCCQRHCSDCRCHCNHYNHHHHDHLHIIIYLADPPAFTGPALQTFVFIRELKQHITSLHHHVTISSPSLPLFVYLFRLLGRACPTIHWIHPTYPILVDSRTSPAKKRKIKKGSDSEVMLKWWWSDGRWHTFLSWQTTL